MNNMTALVSCFARAYHFENNSEHVFADTAAKQLLGDDDYRCISQNMTGGISFFAPGFKGSDQDALRLIAEQHLAPPVLGRSAFCESALNTAVGLGCEQYIIFGAGYDTFAFRNKNHRLKIFELDRSDILADKAQRADKARLDVTGEHTYVPCDLSEKSWVTSLIQSGFDKGKTAFGSLLGLSYYLSQQDFSKLILTIGEIWSEGSSLLFDYPTSTADDKTLQTRQLAAAANESMKDKYSYHQIEKLLENCGFLIYEHLDDKQATERFFAKYNNANIASPMHAPKGVGYCLAVKKRLN